MTFLFSCILLCGDLPRSAFDIIEPASPIKMQLSTYTDAYKASIKTGKNLIVLRDVHRPFQEYYQIKAEEDDKLLYIADKRDSRFIRGMTEFQPKDNALWEINHQRFPFGNPPTENKPKIICDEFR